MNPREPVRISTKYMEVHPDAVDDHPPADEEGYEVPVKSSPLGSNNQQNKRTCLDTQHNPLIYTELPTDVPPLPPTSSRAPPSLPPRSTSSQSSTPATSVHSIPLLPSPDLPPSAPGSVQDPEPAEDDERVYEEIKESHIYT